MLWRIGRKVPLNVYEGDTPICQCHDEAMARRIVEGMNAAASHGEHCAAGLRALLKEAQTEIARLRSALNACDPLDASHIRYLEHEERIAAQEQELTHLRELCGATLQWFRDTGVTLSDGSVHAIGCRVSRLECDCPVPTLRAVVEGG